MGVLFSVIRHKGNTDFTDETDFYGFDLKSV
jgi:hypothetical protein